MKVLKYCFLSSAFFVAVVAIAANINVSFKSRNLNNLELTNVEALAQGEGGGGDVDCFGEGNVTCLGSKYYVRASR